MAKIKVRKWQNDSRISPKIAFRCISQVSIPMSSFLRVFSNSFTKNVHISKPANMQQKFKPVQKHIRLRIVITVGNQKNVSAFPRKN